MIYEGFTFSSIETNEDLEELTGDLLLNNNMDGAVICSEDGYTQELRFEFRRGTDESSDEEGQASGEVFSFYVSEFPGNCSSLVLHGISHFIESHPRITKRIFDFIDAFCEISRHSSVFISLADNKKPDYLKNEVGAFGFRPLIQNLFNPHSGNRNVFYIKTFKWAIAPNEQN